MLRVKLAFRRVVSEAGDRLGSLLTIVNPYGVYAYNPTSRYKHAAAGWRQNRLENLMLVLCLRILELAHARFPLFIRSV